jgi:hypothetical protein
MNESNRWETAADAWQPMGDQRMDGDWIVEVKLADKRTAQNGRWWACDRSGASVSYCIARK